MLHTELNMGRGEAKPVLEELCDKIPGINTGEYNNQ
jgi:hypothetical protein